MTTNRDEPSAITEWLGHLRERLSSPLMASFVVSWCLWNYRFLVILFGEAQISTTFDLLDTYLQRDPYWFRLALGPAFTTALYLFGLPFLDKWVFEFRLSRQLKVNEAKQAIMGATFITESDKRKLLDELQRREAYMTKQIAEVNEENNRLKGMLSKLPVDDTEVTVSPTAEPPDVPVVQQKVALLIEDHGDHAETDTIRMEANRKYGYTRSEVDFAIGELQQADFIKPHHSRNGTRFSLTHQGLALVLKLHQEKGTNEDEGN